MPTQIAQGFMGGGRKVCVCFELNSNCLIVKCLEVSFHVMLRTVMNLWVIAYDSSRRALKYLLTDTTVV